MEKKTFKATKNVKLSAHLATSLGDLSYSVLMKVLRKKDVKVNGKRISTDIELAVGDEVEIFYGVREDRFSVIFQDENILLVDKKDGITSEELFEKLSQRFKDCRFIHRLDRNTSGIIVFALNNESEKSLLLGFKKRTFIKKYIAEVYGNMEKKQDILTAYLKKNSSESLVYISSTPKQDYVEIKTGYRVIERREDSCILEVELFTGKTHQIRSHLAHIGHFVIGDGKYGDNKINKSFKAKYQRLCAYKLTLKFGEGDFLHYLNGKTFSVKCPFYTFNKDN